MVPILVDLSFVSAPLILQLLNPNKKHYIHKYFNSYVSLYGETIEQDSVLCQ